MAPLFTQQSPASNRKMLVSSVSADSITGSNISQFNTSNLENQAWTKQ